jgi:peroxiredoxin
MRHTINVPQSVICNVSDFRRSRMAKTAMKPWSMRPAIAAILWIIAGVHPSWGIAAEPQQTPASPAALTEIEEILRRAGATPADIVNFDESTRARSPAEVSQTVQYLQNASPAELANVVQSFHLKAADEATHPTLKIGATLPEFALKGVDGKTRTPADYKTSPILVVMFISNHCPVSQLYEGREKMLYEEYAAKGVAFVAIQPDNPKAASPSEHGYTDLDDSLESMSVRAAYRKLPFPYLYDGDEQAAARKFGPKVTPHMFIFDRERKLRYEGRIDDSLREPKATTHEARDAIEALLAGKSVPVEHTPVFGCSTKWNGNIDNAQREMREWQAKSVSVESVTLGGLKQLRSNPPGRMLMINFWATWCGPCQTEYPELLTTYQWYRNRGFDFVSVSVDSPESRSDVLRFLNKVHSPIRNLQVGSDDLYAIQKAFDPTWESGVPFTIVLAPDGKIIYRHEGELNILGLRRAILAKLGDNGPFAGNADYWKQ